MSDSLRPHGLYPPGSSVGFSRQEYCIRLPFPSLGDLSDPGVRASSPAFEVDFLLSEPLGNYIMNISNIQKIGKSHPVTTHEEHFKIMTLLLCGSYIPILFSKPLFSRDLLWEAYDMGNQCSMVTQVVPQGFWPSSFRKENNPGCTQVWVWISARPLTSSVKLLLFSHLAMSDSLRPHGLQHARLPCPSLSP